jgi:hypothetical protein
MGLKPNGMYEIDDGQGNIKDVYPQDLSRYGIATPSNYEEQLKYVQDQANAGAYSTLKGQGLSDTQIAPDLATRQQQLSNPQLKVQTPQEQTQTAEFTLRAQAAKRVNDAMISGDQNDLDAAAADYNKLAPPQSQIPMNVQGPGWLSALKGKLTGELPKITYSVDQGQKDKIKAEINQTAGLAGQTLPEIPQTQSQQNKSQNIFQSIDQGIGNFMAAKNGTGPASTDQSPVGPVEGFVGGLGVNAINNTGEMLSTIAKMPGDYITRVQDAAADPTGKKLQQLSQDISMPGIVKNLAIGLLSELNQAVGEPLKGGNFLERAGQRAYEKPVQTLMDLSLFSKVGPEVKGTLPEIVKSPVKGTGNFLKKAAENSQELVSGGGTKEFIEQTNNMDQASTMSKVLLKNDIPGQLTTKGKILATDKALTETGIKLGNVLKDPAYAQIAQTSEFTNNMKSYLLKRFPGQEEAISNLIRDVYNYGDYSLNTGSRYLSAADINAIKTNAMDYGPKAFNSPTYGPIGKDITTEMARYSRNYLALKVKGAIPYLRDYHALKTYSEDILSDPSGLQGMQSPRRFTGGVAKIGSNIAGLVNQGLYNVGAALSPDVLPPITAPTAASSASLVPTETIPVNTMTRQPLPPDIPAGAYNSKGPAQQGRLVRDLRYGQGNFSPVSNPPSAEDVTAAVKSRAAQEKYLRDTTKKKYH